jgi:ribosomal protein S8E
MDDSEMQIKRSGGRRTEERGKRKWELEKERGHKARTGRYTKCSLGKSMLVNCDH